MKRNTIKWTIFKYNLIIIIMLIALTTIIFNITIRLYLENQIFSQLNKISLSISDTALQHGQDYIKPPIANPPPYSSYNSTDNIYRYYFMLDRSLKETLTVLNADFILLDVNKNIISPKETLPVSNNNTNKLVKNEILKINKFNDESYIKFKIEGYDYVAIIKPVSDKNTFGLGWVIIYSSLQEVNRIQLSINIIFFAILIFSSLIIILFSSILSKRISTPFTALNSHIRSIAERNFRSKIKMEMNDEFKELVNNINTMTEKLENYDMAQKVFLQNVSHEFRTPLMSIQSYAEGIKYGVIDDVSAVKIIIDETERLTQLVENMLYLSRLDALEENYNFRNINLYNIISDCVERMNIIAIKNNIIINVYNIDIALEINGDEEKIHRAIINIISNCVRYAKKSIDIYVKEQSNLINVIIEDDGDGFDEKEISNIFERFYKETKGKFGLGLAISRDVVLRHGGNIIAENTVKGARLIIQLPKLE